MEWDYLQPVTIKFGNGTKNQLKDIVKEICCSNGLLVSTPFFVRSGLAEQIVADSDGLLTGIFSELSPNPDVKEVDKCADIIRENGHGFIVALGGGSEVTCVSVLTDHEAGKKAPIVSDGFYPDVAVIDPELTYSMPPAVTASTGIDVLCHAIEGFWSKGHQPICDALALHATELVFKYLERAYKDGNDEEAREKMAEASVIAGMAFTLPKTTASHACSFPLTNIYNIPHGEACGLTLDYFARINAQAEDGRLEVFAKKLGFKDVSDMADAIYDLKERLGLRNDLKDLNLGKEQISELVRISRHPNLYNNPVDITDDMLLEMYQSFA